MYLVKDRIENDYQCEFRCCVEWSFEGLCIINPFGREVYVPHKMILDYLEKYKEAKKNG